ncbi:type IV pilus modification PilV family protein [Geoalkalibacter sp.]|uniref:type IV pilus modification PilV family protein n=1 Tax=Geoalkalibacter sp. TaxID=3041440 RepID=UPI00272E79DD|nr:prepilin-type N-terminal cleavage/methylation domain-containing protein [Geoalkalibacter sp.]
MMKQLFKIRRQRGFTLLELLVAVTIFAVGLLTVAGMQITAMRSNVVADSTSVATAVAQGVLDELLSRPARDAVFNASQNNQPYPLDEAAMSQIPGGGNYVATFDTLLNNPANGMVRINVRVQGNARTVTLTGFKRL